MPAELLASSEANQKEITGIVAALRTGGEMAVDKRT